MTNNELSRKALLFLAEKGGSVRFRDLADQVKADARTIFKNLFFLEEKGYVSLATSYPTADAVYPQIHLVKLRRRGEELLGEPEKLDAVFPLSDTATDVKPHIPPEMAQSGQMTFALVLESLAAHVRESLPAGERDAALEKIEALMALPFVHEKITNRNTKE